MTEQNETAFRAPVKWEQNFCCHSPGHLQLTKNTVEFIPHKVMSVIGKQLVIPLQSIREIRFGDNFLWRGVASSQGVQSILPESILDIPLSAT